MKRHAAAAFAVLSLAVPALAQDRTPSPEGATVYIVEPKAGSTVGSPVTVRFGLSGMGVAPAGVEWENTGHHHLIIDVSQDGFDFAAPILSDGQHRHFGGGQTEVTLDLEPGEHTMWLLLGDAFHVPHDPPVMSEPVTFTVE
ncbi:DUF4399 domain-containing protein [Rhodosalinus sp.]|uniref:DUF4399 domain-containing protein n=1 Tax=Rhodosalinus sp. TaxID=2047741 RepID=UPI00397D9988